MSDSALSNRSFLVYLIGSTISLHGLWIYRVTLGWFTWQLTGSEFWIGAIAFTQLAPAVLFGPVCWSAGRSMGSSNSFDDAQFDQRRQYPVVEPVRISGRSRNLASRCAIAGPGCSGWCAYACAVVADCETWSRDGNCKAQSPARQSRSMCRASSGPAIAGIIISTSGVATAFAVNGLSYLAIVIAVAMIRLRTTRRLASGAINIRQDITEGITYVFRHRSIRSLLLTVAVASLFGRGALEMMPAFADAVFRRGSAGLAILTAAVGMGAIMMGLVPFPKHAVAGWQSRTQRRHCWRNPDRTVRYCAKILARGPAGCLARRRIVAVRRRVADTDPVTGG